MTFRQAEAGGAMLPSAAAEILRSPTVIAIGQEPEMEDTNNPFAVSQTGAQSVAGVDYLFVCGNVGVAKNRGQGQLLLTRTSLFALRVHNQGAATGAAAGGLIGALIGALVDKQQAKGRTAEQMSDPEILALSESVRKKIERSSLLAKLPLGSGLKIERTFWGFKFSDGAATTIVFQGLFRKNKITDFLASLGIDAR